MNGNELPAWGNTNTTTDRIQSSPGVSPSRPRMTMGQRVRERQRVVDGSDLTVSAPAFRPTNGKIFYKKDMVFQYSINVLKNKWKQNN